MSNGITDVNDVIRSWAWENYERTDNSWFSSTSYKDVTFDINWDRVNITPQEPKYTKANSRESSQVVFESKYENDTDDDQTNSFRAEKETVSSAIVHLTKGFSRDSQVNLDLPLPNKGEVPQPGKVMSTFGTRVFIESEEENRIEKKLKWSVDTTILSRKRNVTVAKLEVEETRAEYTFTIRVQLKGIVVVVIRKGGEKIKYIEGDIATILSDSPLTDSLKDLKFDLQKGSANWQMAGSLVLQYGIAQKVNMAYLYDNGSGNKGRRPRN